MTLKSLWAINALQILRSTKAALNVKSIESSNQSKKFSGLSED